MNGEFRSGSVLRAQGQGQAQAQAQAQTQKYLSPFAPNHTASRSNGPTTVRWGGGNASSLQDGDPKIYPSLAAFQQQVVSNRPGSLSPAKTVDFRHVKRTSSPYFPTPDETLKKSRNSTNITIDVPFTDKSYVVPNQTRLPSLDFHNNLYDGGQYPHTEGTPQRPFLSAIQGSSPTIPSRNIIPPADEVIAPVSIIQSGTIFQTKHAGTPLSRQTRSPSLSSTSGIPPKDIVFYTDGHQRHLIDYRDLDAPEKMVQPSLTSGSSSSYGKSIRPSRGTEKRSPSSATNIIRSKYSINGTTPLVLGDKSLISATMGNNQSETRVVINDEDVPSFKSMRSPTVAYAGVEFMQNPAFAPNDHKTNPGHHSQNLSLNSGQNNGIDIGMEKQLPILGAQRSKMLLMSSSDQAFQDDMVTSEEIERESLAKAKRLTRFKDELTRPVQSQSTERNQKSPSGSQRQTIDVKPNLSEESSMDFIGNSSGGNIPVDYEGAVSSSSIVGLCPDMCPDSERAERERKGDLDQYERLDGDRNMSSEFLAVKKYNRTAEREADLIRPMPILQMTMDYLLDLLHKPYDHRFLGLYNFLWDRMRAIRMDLRMQHIFNQEAISMLEQMIRLHIIAMHELCENMRGEGFHEGFDAHLNIEQMNKTSVELFQLYDDHRKKGICVPSEKEFRGYYALLKLDKHPGYKVEPAELSLDLAKMTREMRQSPEVLFARDVARACRTGNFVAFFRLAGKASYLQACLMHAHFSKLRTQALTFLHSGLQINQGIPISHVAKWLGMEEEVIGDIPEFYGFSVKDFEEPYLVKESTFINFDNEFPVKHSKLVERKRSREIFDDVLSPSLSHFEEVKEIMLNRTPEPIRTPSHAGVALSTTPLNDQEMHDIVTISSPKISTLKPIHETSVGVTLPDTNLGGYESPMVPATLFERDLSNSMQNQYTVEHEKPKYNSSFRNSFGRSIKPDLEAAVSMPHISLEVGNENPYAVVSLDSITHAPQPRLTVTEDVEDVERTVTVEEEESDGLEGSGYDKEVAEAKLKLILRTWKRHAVKKRDLRLHKQLATNAALSLLSLGPPIWQYDYRQCNFGAVSIDLVMSERHEIQEKSLSVLNPSDVVAAKLAAKIPDYKCLCWKLVLCIQEGTPQGDNIDLRNKVTYLAACSWLCLKLLPEKRNNHRDLILSCQGLSIWRNWSRGQSDSEELCCLSVIKSSTFGNVDEAHSGASALLFLFSENISLEFQKKQLHGLIMSLPSGSSLPLLILSDSGRDDFDPSTIAQVLELHQIDKSRVAKFHISSLREDNSKQIEGFFSDECLREGLEWLASESPPQVVLREIKTRELVQSHVNSAMVALDEINARRLGPNDCIVAFNEALERSMAEVAAAAHANPTGWPCPEIRHLEESSNEYRAASWYLPNNGWSSSSRTEMLLRAFTDCKLPPLEHDFSWLSRGIYTSDDFENQKTRLESCLVDYITETSEMIGGSFAQKEAGIVLQQFTRLELQNSAYYIIPNWVSIFRRLFNWRLMNLTSKEISSTYVLPKSYFSRQSSEFQNNFGREDVQYPSPCIIHPSLDELIEAGCILSSNHTVFHCSDLPTLKDSAIVVSDEDMNDQENILTSYDVSATTENPNNGKWLVPTTNKSSEEADRLSELLDKCNIVQDGIDRKLAIYF